MMGDWYLAGVQRKVWTIWMQQVRANFTQPITVQFTILPDLPEIARRIAPGGGIVLSGILEERGGEMLRAARGLGFAERARRTAGEWIAFHVARGA